MPSSTICRTVVALGYLVAVALSGRPGWQTAVAAVVLVVVCTAPLLLAHRRHPAAVPVPAVRPGEAL